MEKRGLAGNEVESRGEGREGNVSRNKGRGEEDERIILGTQRRYL